MKNKLIINFTPTGIIPTKDMTPHVPITPEEIAKDVLAAAKLGASIAHLHARDENGIPTYKKEVYEDIIRRIRKENNEIILCVSTSGRNLSEFEKRSECLDIGGDLKPDMASLTLSSLNFNDQASINSPDMIKMLAQKMIYKDIKPELEVFDVGMINYAKYLIKKGLLNPPYYFNLLFGNIACAQATLLNVGIMLNELPEKEDTIWALSGIGIYQHEITSLAIVWNGGVRIGLEDNIWYDAKRTKLATNIELIERVVNTAKVLGREIATPKEVRKMLGLRQV